MANRLPLFISLLFLSVDGLSQSESLIYKGGSFETALNPDGKNDLYKNQITNLIRKSPIHYLSD